MVPHELCRCSVTVRKRYLYPLEKDRMMVEYTSKFLKVSLSRKAQEALQAASLSHWFHMHWSSIFNPHYLSGHILLTILFSIVTRVAVDCRFPSYKSNPVSCSSITFFLFTHGHFQNVSIDPFFSPDASTIQNPRDPKPPPCKSDRKARNTNDQTTLLLSAAIR